MRNNGPQKRSVHRTPAVLAVAFALALAASVAAGSESHPVGVSYRQAVEKDPSSYNPPESLPARLHLPGGLVGCITCHTERGMDTGELVMGNEKSQLCAACHRK
ncbi:MAG: cytochrome c3 family protein [Candidatus Nitrospinota bacterium M3_3B_026]